MEGNNLNQVLNIELKEITSPQDRGALQDLSYGTLRFYGLLQQVLNLLLNKPIQDVRIQHLLLIALYQLKYSKASPYTVVDHAVQAAKKINSSASGLVNAVLRNFLRKSSELLKKAEQTDEGKYSYPLWWILAIKQQYGEEAEQILQAGNMHPPMTLRVNQSQISVADYLTRLIKKEISAEEIKPKAIIICRPVAIQKIPGFLEGDVSVQDAGAQYAADLLDVHDGMRVLDACAAPGGKSGHLLEKAAIKLTAVDKDELRLQRVRENLSRINQEADLICGDVTKPQEWWDGRKFSRILADVPCSGSGVVRRHPDIKWLRRPSDITGFAKQQAIILYELWPLLECNGKLLYVTCSIFKVENQQVIDSFLHKHADAQQHAITISEIKDGQIIPSEKHDGFFYALLQKHA
jgi:16S rRNA (cytosine967-C5)-methyltransferase